MATAAKAKQLTANIKLIINAGSAKPAPPVCILCVRSQMGGLMMMTSVQCAVSKSHHSHNRSVSLEFSSTKLGKPHLCLQTPPSPHPSLFGPLTLPAGGTSPWTGRVEHHGFLQGIQVRTAGWAPATTHCGNNTSRHPHPPHMPQD